MSHIVKDRVRNFRGEQATKLPNLQTEDSKDEIPPPYKGTTATKTPLIPYSNWTCYNFTIAIGGMVTRLQNITNGKSILGPEYKQAFELKIIDLCEQLSAFVDQNYQNLFQYDVIYIAHCTDLLERMGSVDARVQPLVQKLKSQIVVAWETLSDITIATPYATDGKTNEEDLWTHAEEIAQRMRNAHSSPKAEESDEVLVEHDDSREE